jgi:extracellular factor (EF) 3-hydroxypalmitic acid methyl ester biosynthesis protein
MRRYEDLMGGAGAAVRYRAPRYATRDLFGDDVAVIRMGQRSFPLVDLSAEGASFQAPARGGGPELGEHVAVQLLVAGCAVHEGGARVVRDERNPRGRRVAVQLLDGFLDVHELWRSARRRLLDAALRAGPEATLAEIPETYQRLLLEAVHFFRFYEAELGAAEAAGDGGPEHRRRIVEQALDGARPRWVALRARLSAAAVDLRTSRRAYLAARQATVALVGPCLRPAPVLRRAWEKPLGYPGDYQVMNLIYANELEGDTAYGAMLHRLACEEPLAAGVRGRRDWMLGLLRAEHARVDPRPFHAVSLGCGPALEAVGYVSTRDRPSGPSRWTLIDQEERALSQAHHALSRALRSEGGAAQVRGLYLSFDQLMRDPSAVRAEPADLVYSMGLFDYLLPGTATALLQALYELLRPGGVLVVANALGPNTHGWMTELALDWDLIFRTPAELRALARPLEEAGARVCIEVEPAGAYAVMQLRRPDEGAAWT